MNKVVEMDYDNRKALRDNKKGQFAKNGQLSCEVNLRRLCSNQFIDDLNRFIPFSH